MNKLRFQLADATAEDGEVLLTTRALTVFVADTAVWPARGAADVALEIQIDDLLAHLTEFWKPLTLRQTYPLTINPDRPSHLRAEAVKRWAALPEILAEQEDERLSEFQDAHDISRAFAGYFDLPALWLFRIGQEMLVDTGEAFETIPFANALEGLTTVGDEIADLLRKSGLGRWDDLLNAWHIRDQSDSISLLAWSTSLDPEVARALTSDGTLIAPKDFAEAVNDNNELRLAARMAGSLPLDQVRWVIERVRRFPRVNTPELHALASSVSAHIEAGFLTYRPYEQGQEIARFVRNHFQLPGTDAADVLGMLERLGVVVDCEAIEPRNLEGLAVWGEQHGPAVLLNEKSPRHSANVELRRNGGARVTLAHEFCHLIIDAGHALSAVDVLNSRMPLAIEQRARAFAAELLLPCRVAADLWVGADKPRQRDDLNRFLMRLCRRFNVTKSVAAWKLEHGAFEHDEYLGPLLDVIVPQRRTHVVV